jgi:hypothetical protein
MEYNIMRELDVTEIEQVNGGMRNLWWYLGGKLLDAALEADWGSSMDDPDTNLAP